MLPKKLRTTILEGDFLKMELVLISKNGFIYD